MEIKLSGHLNIWVTNRYVALFFGITHDHIQISSYSDLPTRSIFPPYDKR